MFFVLFILLFICCAEGAPVSFSFILKFKEVEYLVKTYNRILWAVVRFLVPYNLLGVVNLINLLNSIYKVLVEPLIQPSN